MSARHHHELPRDRFPKVLASTDIFIRKPRVAGSVSSVHGQQCLCGTSLALGEAHRLGERGEVGN